jgi:tripartite-type tricarboxylate transporter receptor subunit TctC
MTLLPRLSRRRIARVAIHMLLAASAATLAAQAAFAQNWPEKPVRLIVTTPPGGPIDSLARILGEAVAKHTRQPVVIENKAGGSGAIALGYTIRQPADGYTLLITANAAFSLIPIVRTMPYKPLDDFSFLGQLAFTPNVFAVTGGSPARNMKEFVAHARSQPGQLNYGMMLGVPHHLDFERFKKDTGTDIALVPYTGGAPIVNGLLSGEVDVTLFNAPLFAEWAKSGKLRVLATTAKTRIAQLPDVPTMAEAGFPNLKLAEGSFYSLAAPAGLPKPLAKRIYQVFGAVAKDPEVRKKLESIGFEVSLRDGVALKSDIAHEFSDNVKLVKSLNIKLTE